jgi:hypothetical protein
MWPTWGTLPPWWHHVMRVVLVVVALCLSASACTTSGRSGSTPAALPHEGGYVGPRDSGKSGDGFDGCVPLCIQLLTIFKKPHDAAAPFGPSTGRPPMSFLLILTRFSWRPQLLTRI